MTKKKIDERAEYIENINKRLDRVHRAALQMKAATELLTTADAAITKADIFERLLNKAGALGLEADEVDGIFKAAGSEFTTDLCIKAVVGYRALALRSVTAAQKIGEQFDAEWKAE